MSVPEFQTLRYRLYQLILCILGAPFEEKQNYYPLYQIDSFYKI